MTLSFAIRTPNDHIRRSVVPDALKVLAAFEPRKCYRRALLHSERHGMERIKLHRRLEHFAKVGGLNIIKVGQTDLMISNDFAAVVDRNVIIGDAFDANFAVMRTTLSTFFSKIDGITEREWIIARVVFKVERVLKVLKRDIDRFVTCVHDTHANNLSFVRNFDLWRVLINSAVIRIIVVVAVVVYYSCMSTIDADIMLARFTRLLS
jgi:hypothetical protein